MSTATRRSVEAGKAGRMAAGFTLMELLLAVSILAMLLVGFGFLMVFVRKYGYGATTGTYLVVAVGIPLYVLCDSLKFSPQLRNQILVEDSPGEDVMHRETLDTFTVWNRYFEWIPIELVTSFITERGVCPASAVGLRHLYPELDS